MKSFFTLLAGAVAVTALPQLSTTPAAAMTTKTTSAAALAIPTPAASYLKDEFRLHGLKTTKRGSLHDITFWVSDLSTAPIETTKCHIHWQGPHIRHGAAKCENGWFTAAVVYWDDPQSFGLSINHAYGETCIGCNDEDDDDYYGDVGSCAIQLDGDKMKNLEGDEHQWSSKAHKDITCFIDFDDASS